MFRLLSFCSLVAFFSLNAFTLSPKLLRQYSDVRYRKTEYSFGLLSTQVINEHLEEAGKSTLYKSDAAKFGIDTVLAVGLLEEGMYEDAEKLARKAMALGEHTGEKDNIYTAYAEGILGDILYKMGSTVEAADHYRSALRTYERHYRSSSGPEAIQMLGATQMVSWKLLADGKYKDAIDACSTALGLAETILGSNAPDVGKCMFNLGVAFLNSGDLGPRAEAMFTQAINIFEDADVPQYTNIGNCLGSLGNLYFERADYDAAEKAYLRVKHLIDENLFHGAEAAPSLKNLGGIYWRRGRLDDAAALYRQALGIFEETEEYGPSHDKCNSLRTIIRTIEDEKEGIL